jgi:hypothetical protein
MDNTLYFVANDGAQDGLYKHDETGFTPMPVASAPSGNYLSLIPTDGMLYFIYFDYDEPLIYQLWKTNGSGGPAVKIKDFDPMPYEAYPDEFEVLQGKIYLTFADEEGCTTEIWQSDGSEANTLPLVEVEPCFYDADGYPYRAGLEAVGGALFFAHYTDQYGPELWKHCP